MQLGMVLFERNQTKLSEKNMNRAFHNLNKVEIDAEGFYFYKYQLENQTTYYRFASNYAYLDKVFSKPDWENVFTDLTNFYVLKSMIMYLNTLNLHKLYNKKLHCESLISVINKIKPEDYEDTPVIKLYYYLIKLKTDIKHEYYYFKLKEFILTAKRDFNKYDLMSAYVHMGGYCIDRISEGKLKFERERFDLYKEELIEKTYEMGDNTMSPLFYRNVVISAITLKELSWAKNFIHTYKPELNKKFRGNYFNYCLALFEFTMKNFEYSLELISKITYDEIYMKLKTKILHLQVLYELEFEDTLFSTLESFRHFLSNNKTIPEERKLDIHNFNRCLNKIILIKNKGSKSELDLLRNFVSKENNLINKDWLLEKVKSL